MENIIQTVDLKKIFITENGLEVFALNDINLEIGDQEFVCILGPSGSGKSTLLRLLAGLDFPSSGEVKILGENIKAPMKEANMVFQEYSLMPWLNVIDNTAFGLEVKGVNKKERHQTASDILDKFGLGDFKKSYPHELSGGMRQRVAIARSVVNDPRILYMDEPFGALDSQTRFNMQNDLVDYWIDNQRTVVFVTHSVEEAVLLGTRIIMLSERPGKIIADIEIDLPYPRNRWNEEFGDYFKKIMKIQEPIEEDFKVDGKDN